MANNGSKAKITIRRTVAPEPVALSELEAVERILARFVALTYVGDHPELFIAGTKEQPAITAPSSCVLPFGALYRLGDRSSPK